MSSDKRYRPDTIATIKKYEIDFDGNFSAFGRLLHEKTGTRSPTAWAMSYRRYLGITTPKKDIQTKEKMVSDPNVAPSENRDSNLEEQQPWLTDREYYFDQATDTYLTYLRVAGQQIQVPGITHREMKEAYSNMVGKGSTINQIARDFNFPRHWFDEYRRRHCWTHDMDPFTDEQVLEHSTEELVDDLVLRNRRMLHRKFEQRKWDEIQKDADKWRSFEELVLSEMKSSLAEHWKPVIIPKMDWKPCNRPYALVISPTDFHWGKYGWEDEVGETYNFEEAKKRLMERTEDLIARLPGRPEKIILATGSDWFHVDNHQGATTKGTPQDMEGSPAQILMSGCELARAHIDLLRQIAPVDVYFMRGNHDKHSALTLMLYLSAAYENAKDVFVNVDPKVRHYAVYGNTMIGFTHGDNTRIPKLPLLMATEKRQEWGDCKFKVWFSGHKHHQVLKEMEGVMLVQLPSLAGHDRWHHQAGYVMSNAGLCTHLIDYEQGLISSMFSPVHTE